MKKEMKNDSRIEHEDYMPETSEVVELDAEQAYQEAVDEMDAEVDAEATTEKDFIPPEIRYIPLYQGGEEEEKRVKHLHRFYTLDIKHNKHGEFVGYNIDLDNYIIIDVLKELGFYRYDQPNGTFEYVKIQNNIITLLRDPQVIVDAFEDYVTKLPPMYHRMIGGVPIYVRTDHEKNIKYVKSSHIEITNEKLLKRIYKNIMYYFSSTLPRLRPAEPIRLLEDTKNSKYIFYNNGIVRVSKDGIQFASFYEIEEYEKKNKNCFLTDVTEIMEAIEKECNGKYIWSTNILNRNFKYEYIDKDGKKSFAGDSDFEIFTDCICGNAVGYYEQVLVSGEVIRTIAHHIPEDKDPRKFLIQQERKWALMNIFGYLMHNNYECNMKSVMFIDMNKESENAGKPAGGTGKGIIGKALGHMMNRTENDRRYIAVAGKNFDPEDERRYSEGDITTQLIHVEDIKSSFHFEGFFNDVTDGAVFRKMYQDKTRHKVKLMISSNQAIDISAPSCKRRMVVFELDNFFNEHKTPQDMFGKRFFESEWNDMDWARFDFFMVNCCLNYMQEKDKVGADGKVIGLRQPPLLNYENMLLRSKLNNDFIAWFEAQIEDAMQYKIERCFSKNGLYTLFSTKYTEFASERQYKRAFTGWCKFYLQTKKIPSAEKRSTEDLLILFPNPDPKISYIYRDVK